MVDIRVLMSFFSRACTFSWMTPKTASLSVAFWRQLTEEKARSRRASSLGEVTQIFNIASRVDNSVECDGK